jgi:hypothetical protein
MRDFMRIVPSARRTIAMSRSSEHVSARTQQDFSHAVFSLLALVDHASQDAAKNDWH